MTQTAQRPTKQDVLEHWKQLLHAPRLNDLPYKIETNARSQLILSPVTKRHSYLQSQILFKLMDMLEGGYAMPEVSILTEDGVRVADVAWVSVDAYDAAPEELFTTAPEICVEVWSPSNTPEEFDRKRALYFQAGAVEVWECDQDGQMRFFGSSGKMEQSRLVAAFPKNVLNNA
jgi:Uma2 family endonuclease